MEKSKIIEYVLNEWAMRSPDGLADGFDVQENIDLLENILKEYGLDEEDIQNVMEKTAKPRKPKAPRVLDSVWSKGKISLASLQAKNIPEDNRKINPPTQQWNGLLRN
jgi:3-oxoacyl-[acyl-carrier-protein] synthase III